MALDIARIDAVLFDVDGTLSDTDDQWVSRVEQSLRPVSFVLPGKDTKAAARWLVMGAESPGNWGYELLDRLHLDDEAGRLMDAMSRRKSDGKHTHRLIPRVIELLTVLHGRFPMAVVSARGERSTLEFLQHHGLMPYFGAVATALTCPHTKPFPDPLLWASNRLGVAPERCLMVGDTVVDIRAGKAAQAQTVGVLCGFGSERELRRVGADLILPSTGDLIEALAVHA